MRSRFLIFGLLAGCSALEPNVGPKQDAGPTCGATPASTPIYGGASAPAGDAGACVAPDPRCAPDGGYEDGECDRCEDTYCCATRFECYDDPGCFIADQALDSCVSGDASANATCFDVFSSAGPIEKIRETCQRNYCRVPCGIP